MIIVNYVLNLFYLTKYSFFGRKFALSNKIKKFIL